MLKQLYIKNFTLIDELNIKMYPGFSVITGETGAGKSIILGAIGLLLGNRADSKSIKLDRDRCVIEAHFEMTDQANASDNPGKFQDIIKRRLRRGQAYSQPYLGTRECTAHFGLWEGGEIPTISETRDLGLMLYDMDFSDPNDIQPMFFRAKLENGVLDLTDCEVIK